MNEPLGGALPALVSAGIAAAFVGGHIIVALPALTLALTAAPRVISHPRALWAKLTRRHQTPALTDDERRIAEAYDDEWQLADRARNRRFPRPG